jgi:hypothetical protein
LISLAVLLSGVALTPYVKCRVNAWAALYAGIYEAQLVVNHAGQPGSYFTLRGNNFRPTVECT